MCSQVKERAMTEIERVNSASDGAKKWLEERIAFINSNREQFEVVGNYETHKLTKCVFCGREINHMYSEDSSDSAHVGWAFSVNIKDKELITALYCNCDCEGEEKNEFSEEAKQFLLWREGEGCTYTEILGTNGFQGTVEDTKYYDGD